MILCESLPENGEEESTSEVVEEMSFSISFSAFWMPSAAMMEPEKEAILWLKEDIAEDMVSRSERMVWASLLEFWGRGREWEWVRGRRRWKRKRRKIRAAILGRCILWTDSIVSREREEERKGFTYEKGKKGGFHSPQQTIPMTRRVTLLLFVYQ